MLVFKFETKNIKMSNNWIIKYMWNNICDYYGNMKFHMQNEFWVW